MNGDELTNVEADGVANNRIGGDNVAGTLGDNAKNSVIGNENAQTTTEYHGANSVTFNQDNANFQIYQAVQDIRYQLVEFKQHLSLSFSELKQQVMMQTSLTNDKLDLLNRRVSALEQGAIDQNHEIGQIRQDGHIRERQLHELHNSLDQYADAKGMQKRLEAKKMNETGYSQRSAFVIIAFALALILCMALAAYAGWHFRGV